MNEPSAVEYIHDCAPLGVSGGFLGSAAEIDVVKIRWPGGVRFIEDELTVQETLNAIGYGIPIQRHMSPGAGNIFVSDRSHNL